MKKNIFSLVILLALAFQVVTVSAEDFSEESTVVESSVQASAVVADEFDEESTVVDNTSSSDQDEDEFGEESTIVDSVPAPVLEDSSNSSNSSSRRGGSRRVPTANLSSGEVLGASTDGSCKLLSTYMKLGNENNVEEVKMLQTFLNENLKISLPVTGFFGPLTEQAVKDFQVKFSTDVLKPWVDLGLIANDDMGTGYVYKTTQFAINKILCPDADIDAPVLN